MLWLAQGKADAAEAVIRRVAAETSAIGKRAGLMPACGGIMLAIGDLEAGRGASRELEPIAAGHDSGGLDALPAQPRLEDRSGDVGRLSAH